MAKNRSNVYLSVCYKENSTDTEYMTIIQTLGCLAFERVKHAISFDHEKFGLPPIEENLETLVRDLYLILNSPLKGRVLITLGYKKLESHRDIDFFMNFFTERKPGSVTVKSYSDGRHRILTRTLGDIGAKECELSNSTFENRLLIQENKVLPKPVVKFTAKKLEDVPLFRGISPKITREDVPLFREHCPSPQITREDMHFIQNIKPRLDAQVEKLETCEVDLPFFKKVKPQIIAAPESDFFKNEESGRSCYMHPFRKKNEPILGLPDWRVELERPSENKSSNQNVKLLQLFLETCNKGLEIYSSK